MFDVVKAIKKGLWGHRHWLRGGIDLSGKKEPETSSV